MAGFPAFLFDFNLFIRFEEELQLQMNTRTRRNLEGFRGLIPLRLEAILSFIDFFIWDLEGNVLIWSSSENQISTRQLQHAPLLEVFIGCLHLLLECAHKAVARLQVGFNLRILDLEHQSELSRGGILLFDDLIARTTDFDRATGKHLRDSRCRRSNGLVLFLVQRFYT